MSACVSGSEAGAAVIGQSRMRIARGWAALPPVERKIAAEIDPLCLVKGTSSVGVAAIFAAAGPALILPQEGPIAIWVQHRHNPNVQIFHPCLHLRVKKSCLDTA